MLRPAFTRDLAARLRQGACINMTAPHGFGRRRTLKDLRAILAADMHILHADMKFCRHDFSAMMHELCLQADLQPPAEQAAQLPQRLAERNNPTLLILHNLDLLRSESCEPRFRLELLPSLHLWRESPRLALLCVCEDVYPDWPLPCETRPLPPLPDNRRNQA